MSYTCTPRRHAMVLCLCAQIMFFSAVVRPFEEQAQAAAQGVEVHGMLGMEFLEQCDVQFHKVRFVML